MLIHNAQVTGSLILNGIDIGDITGSEVSIGALNSFSASINVYTGSNNININALQTFSSSILTYTGSNDTLNNTQNSRLSSLETTSGSLLTASGSFSTRVSNTETTSSNLTTASSSFSTRVANNESTGSSLVAASASFSTRVANTEATASSLTTASGSFSTRTTNLETASGSFSTRVTNAESSVTSLNSKTGSYATTGSNTFSGTQTITGSLFVTQNLVVQGSSSINYISQSTLNIGTNLITVNAQNPSIRFGGLAVIDSGSVPQVSGSWLFDSIQNRWIMIHEQTGGVVTSSIALMGPETYNSLGSETTITSNRLVKGYPGASGEHIGDSNISDTGTVVSINSNTQVTGSLVTTGNVGIGTSSSTTRLQIDKSSQTYSSSTPSGATIISNLAGGNGILELGVDTTYLSYIQSRNITNTTFYSLLLQPLGGNVGIGTVSPIEKLHVDGNIYIASGDVYGATSYSDAAVNKGMSFSGTNLLFNNSGERVRITSSGSLLIGTTSAISGNGRMQLLVGGNANGSTLALGNSGDPNKFVIESDSGENAIINNRANTPMIFYTSGSRRMDIAANGNVGIGTSSPLATLHVLGSDAGFRITGTSRAQMLLTNATSQWQIESPTGASNVPAGAFGIIESGIGSRLTILTGGNIGIGTTSPSQKLHVVGSTAVAAGDLLLTQGYGITWNSGDNYIKGIEGYHLQFTTYDGVSAQTEVMRLTGGSSGGARVGIGTTSPVSLFQVAGTSTLGSSASNGDVTVISNTTPFLIKGRSSYDRGFMVLSWDVSPADCGVIITNSLKINVNATPGSNTGSTAVYINTNGNVGIGATNPIHKLEVAGNISINGGSFLDFANGDVRFVNSSGLLSVQTYSVGTGLSTKMTVTGAGNVGIGSTSPAYRLDIAGTARANGMTLYGFATGTSGGNLELGFDGSQGVVQAYNRSAAWIPLYLSGADIRFNPGGVEKMRIDSNGNVGIGTTSPIAMLHIESSNSQGDFKGLIYLKSTSGNNVLKIGVDGTNNFSELRAYTPGSGDNSRLVFQPYGGNVGIGTTSPGVALDVAGSIRSSNVINWNGGVGALSWDTGLVTMETNTSTAIQLKTNGSTRMHIAAGGNVGIGTTAPGETLTIGQNTAGNSTSYSLAILRNGTTSAPGTWLSTPAINITDIAGDGPSSVSNTNALLQLSLPRVADTDTYSNNAFFINCVNDNGSAFVVTAKRNVGIGTTSPGYKLEVAGNLKISSGLVIAPVNSDLYATDGTLSYYATTNGVYLNGAGTNGWLRLNGSGDENYQNCIDIYGSAGARIEFRTGNSERMRITSGGNVGIGTTSPNHKLHVTGTEVAFDTSGAMRFYINRTGTNVGSIIFTTGGTGTANGWGEIGQTDANGDMYFKANPSAGGFTTRMIMRGATGHIVPGANGTQNLGSDTERWATVFTSDLSLSNGIGDYTIVEGENDLFLYNNKQNKVYKFMLAEVDPADATPKKS